MKTYDLYERAMEPVKNWWMYLLIGVLAFVLGVFMLTNPAITYEMMTLLFGLALVIFGIIQMIVGIFSRNIFVSRDLHIFEGGNCRYLVRLYGCNLFGILLNLWPYYL